MRSAFLIGELPLGGVEIPAKLLVLGGEGVEGFLEAVEFGEIGLKATTCEGMGFVGRREGLVAMAVVTLESA